MKFTNYLLLERNIINIKEIDGYINMLKSEVYHFSDIGNWIARNLKNYLLRQHPVHPVDSRNIISTFGKQEGSWIQKAIDRNEELSIISLDTEFRNTVYHILEYFHAVTPQLNISRMTFQEAERQADEWTEEQNKKASDKEDKTGLEEVRKYPDGFRWVQVISKQSLDREGKLMKHCVGSYCDQVSSGSTMIYSLRDKKNEPHCTVEVQSNKVNQIKSKANGPVDGKYIKYAHDFIMKPVSGKQYTEVNDLRNIGLIEVGSKYYDINNLPENLHVKGDLYLYKGSSLTSLPKGLKVGGSLYLLGCESLRSLPKDLKVGGTLDLTGCKSLTSLPKGLSVGGYLDLDGCINLKTLPEDLEVKSLIYMHSDMKKYFQNSKFKDKLA